MHIVALGLNHRTAPVAIREKFAMAESRLPQALVTLKQTMSVQECVIVNTCNRMEIYAVIDSKVCGRFIYEFVEKWFGASFEQCYRHLYLYEDREAVRHLFKVTCGLDSMVIGETQILGQVRDSFQVAQQSAATGVVFNTLFKRAITLAKRVHAEIGINDNPVSISYAAVELGKQLLGSYEYKTAMIVGAGQMSELTCKHLNAVGTGRIIVANRSYEKAAELAASAGGVACGFDTWTNYMAEADIVISSTGSADTILTAERVAQVMEGRPERQLVLIDIAVPRDCDPLIRHLSGVHLYDIDDLESIIASNMQERLKEVDKIERYIEKEIDDFEQWQKTSEIAPVIEALQRKVISIHEHTMQDLENKLPELTERQRKLIRKLSKSIANQLVREPILRVKELSIGRDRDRAIEMFTRMFALEPWLSESVRDDVQETRTVRAEGNGV